MQSRNIDHIIVTMPHIIEISNYAACAVMQDHVTVQKLYAEEDSTNSQILIFPYDRSNPEDQSILPIDEVLFVVFGTVNDPSKFSCDDIIGAKIINTVADFNLTKQFTVRQNLKALVKDLPDLTFKVELTGD
jgi:hypothetical protein